MVDVVNPPRVPFEDPISTFVSEHESPSAKVYETPLSKQIGRSEQGGDRTSQIITQALGRVHRRYPGKSAEKGTRVTLPWLRWFNFVDTAITQSSPNTDILGIAGEAFTAPCTVYLSEGDGGTTPGYWYLTDADLAPKSTGAKIVGHVAANTPAGQQATIRIVGRVTGRTGLVAGTVYYLGSTPGSLVAAPANRPFALADTATSFVIIEPDTAGTPAGNDTEIQFNDAGAFGADPDFTWDKANDILTLTDTATSGGRLRIGKGTTALPAISFVGDTNTGIFQNGAGTGTISLVLDGVEVALFRGDIAGPHIGLDRIVGEDVFICSGTGMGQGYTVGGMGNSIVAGLRLDSGNTRLCIGHSSTNKQFGALGGVVFTNGAAATVSNTVTETTLVATARGIGATFPADNVYALAGRTFRVKAWGTIANTGTPTLQLKFKIATNVMIDTTAMTLAGITGTQGWTFEGEAVVRTAATSVVGNGTFSYSTAAGTTVTHITANTTGVAIASTTLDFTAQWGTADAANVITCQNLTVELIN